MAYNKQQWKDEIPDLTKPIRDSSGKQKTDPQTGRPLYELVQEGTRLTSQRLNHIEDGIETVHELADQNAADIDTHKKDTVKHITAAERAEWKAKETPAGAQTKADAALSSAKTYADTALLAKADKSSTYSKTETDQRIQAVVGAAPDALDTLKEIGDALNNDPNFAATVTNQLSSKVDKVAGKQLSTEDYSSSEKAKLAGLTPGAGGAGSATDATIGYRTADPSIATPYSLTGTITQWFSWIAKYFKAITGKANPFDAPDITLAATKTHVDNTTVHITATERTAWNAAETNAKNASIPKTDKGAANGVAGLDANVKVPDAQIPSNIARKAAEITISGTDLNTFLTEGEFNCTSDVLAATFLNMPSIKYAFYLKVSKHAGYNQTMTIYGTSAVGANRLRTFSRNFYNATWSNWFEIENTNSKDVANGYTGLDGNAFVPDARLSPNVARVGQQIPTTSDLNSLMTEGTYFIGSSAQADTILNKPSGRSPFGLVVTVQSARVIQELTTNDATPRKFVRSYSASAWQPWLTIETTNQKNGANGYGGLDASAKLPRANTYNSLSGTTSLITNLDTAYTAGTYGVNSTASGSPSAGEYGQVLIHVSTGETHDNSGNWIWQMFFGTTGATYLRRKVNNGAWAAWVPLWTGYNDNLLIRQRSNVGAGTDLNTVVTPGVHHLSASSSYTNGPGIDWCIMNVYVTSTAYVVQEAYSVNMTSRSVRTRTELGVWSAWIPVITGAGGTMEAPLVRKYGASSVKHHNLASYYSNGVVTGTIKITLPVAWTQAMMRIKVSGYEYANNKGAWELTLGGYNFTTGWAQVSAYAEGGLPFNSVRFAYDGAKCCILLGGLTTPWNYPSIEVSEVLASHNGSGGLGGAWTVTLLAAETGITSVFAAPISWGNANTLNGYAPSFAATANTIPIRNDKGELEGVSSVLAKVDDTPITNSSAGIMALNYMVTGTDQTLNVSAYLSLMGASSFSMYISYTDPRLGLKNYEICPLKRLEGEAYVFIPVFIRAKAGSEVRLIVVHSDDAYPAYITASIGKG